MIAFGLKQGSATMPQHEGYQNAVNLTVSLCLTYTLCIACVRIWIRKSAYGIDDFVIAVATLVTLANTASSYASLSQGLGLPWYRLQHSDKLPALNEVMNLRTRAPRDSSLTILMRLLYSTLRHSQLRSTCRNARCLRFCRASPRRRISFAFTGVVTL